MDTWLDILVEAIGVIVGFILGLLFPSLGRTRLWKRWRTHRALRRIEKLNVGSESGHYRWHSFHVDHITPIHLFVDPHIALTSEGVTTHYEDLPKPLPAEIESLRHTYLPEYIDFCKGAGLKYHDDPTYSLDRANISRSVTRSGRILTIDLHFSPTHYSTFAMANLALDKRILDSGGDHISIRSKYSLTPETFDPDHLERIPLHLKFDSGTVVVTSDNLIVLPKRSATQAVATGDDPHRTVVHVVGEAMLRPHDSVKTGRLESPSPFLTVRRALKDELNLSDLMHYSPRDIRFLAILFDFQRYQPVGLFTITLEITAEELEAVWPFAKDAHEHAGMFYLPNEPKEVRRLLEGNTAENGRPLIMGSNQAEMFLFLSLFHYHPLSDVERAFTARA